MQKNLFILLFLLFFLWTVGSDEIRALGAGEEGAFRYLPRGVLAWSTPGPATFTALLFGFYSKLCFCVAQHREHRGCCSEQALVLQARFACWRRLQLSSARPWWAQGQQR